MVEAVMVVTARAAAAGGCCAPIVSWGMGAMVFANIALDRFGLQEGRFLKLLFDKKQTIPIDTRQGNMGILQR